MRVTIRKTLCFKSDSSKMIENRGRTRKSIGVRIRSHSPRLSPRLSPGRGTAPCSGEHQPGSRPPQDPFFLFSRPPLDDDASDDAGAAAFRVPGDGRGRIAQGSDREIGVGAEVAMRLVATDRHSNDVVHLVGLTV